MEQSSKPILGSDAAKKAEKMTDEEFENVLTTIEATKESKDDAIEKSVSKIAVTLSNNIEKSQTVSLVKNLKTINNKDELNLIINNWNDIKDGFTLLIKATYHNNVEIVKSLLQCKV